MRVYTNQVIRDFWAYVKFAATIAALYFMVSHAMHLWSDEPVVQQFHELREAMQEE